MSVTASELLVAACALSGGGLAASLAAPLRCDWDRNGLKRRLFWLGEAAPGRYRRLAGATFLALALTGGAALAYAAEPSAPDQLPKEVIGVVGSGDKLSLQVKTGEAAPRTVKVGEEYKDGWTLQAVTPTKATLSKGGQMQEVGLNPSGAIAQAAPSGPPSTVTVARPPADPATVQRRSSGR